MTEYLFLQPLDVLYLRGNRLFGAAGDHGEALMPPWPSLAAGAIRSHMLASSKVDLAAFADGKATPEGRLGECLGTPEQPGSFRVKVFTLASTPAGLIPIFPTVRLRLCPCFPYFGRRHPENQPEAAG